MRVDSNEVGGHGGVEEVPGISSESVGAVFRASWVCSIQVPACCGCLDVMSAFPGLFLGVIITCPLD